MADLPFPKSLHEFQKLFPNDAACAEYLERIHWWDGFRCRCGHAGEPYRFAAKPHILRCKKCRADTSLTAGTVMERTRMPLSVWFWASYLVSTMTPSMSAVQFQRQLGLTRYETAFQILRKLRAGMVRADRDRIDGGNSFRSLLGVRTPPRRGRRLAPDKPLFLHVSPHRVPSSVPRSRRVRNPALY